MRMPKIRLLVEVRETNGENLVLCDTTEDSGVSAAYHLGKTAELLRRRYPNKRIELEGQEALDV